MPCITSPSVEMPPLKTFMLGYLLEEGALPKWHLPHRYSPPTLPTNILSPSVCHYSSCWEEGRHIFLTIKQVKQTGGNHRPPLCSVSRVILQGIPPVTDDLQVGGCIVWLNIHSGNAITESRLETGSKSCGRHLCPTRIDLGVH